MHAYSQSVTFEKKTNLGCVIGDQEKKRGPLKRSNAMKACSIALHHLCDQITYAITQVMQG